MQRVNNSNKIENKQMSHRRPLTTDLFSMPLARIAKCLGTALLAAGVLAGVAHGQASQPSTQVAARQAAPPRLQAGQSMAQLRTGDWLIVGKASPAGGAISPSGALFLRNQQSGEIAPIALTLRMARSGQSSTLLPDGRVLILGGAGAGGEPVAVPEILDIETGMGSALPDPGLIARSQHTATLLADGRVLITGGVDGKGNALYEAEILDAASFTVERFNLRAETARLAHLAQLLPSNAVLLSGGVGRDGLPVPNGEIYDAAALRFTPVSVSEVQRLLDSLGGIQPGVLAGSSPAAGASAVDTGAPIVLRFSKWMDPASITSASVKLSAGGVDIPARVIPAERGMLVFVTPEGGLPAAVRVTVDINGVRDAAGQPMFATALNFETSSASSASVRGNSTGRAVDARGSDSAAQAAARTRIIDAASGPRANESALVNLLGKIPVFFELNTGNYPGDVKFSTHGGGYQLQLSGQQTRLKMRQLSAKGKAMAADSSLRHRWREDRIRRLANRPGSVEPTEEDEEFEPLDVSFELVGANPNPRVTGLEPLQSKTHYYYGSDASQWRTNVPHFAKVLQENVYPGIDQVYHGVEGQLEYDWVVKPGANPGAIAQRINGARSIAVQANGDLLINAGEISVRQRRPVAYQVIEGVRVPVEASFRVSGNVARIEVAAYDKRQPLVIDPVIDFSTYLASTLYLTDMAVADDGSVYTLGRGFGSPTTTPSPGSNQYPTWVVKLTPNGRAIDFIAGFYAISPYALTIDNSGASPQAYLIGNYNRPSTGTGQFIAKMSANGASLPLYSEYANIFNQPSKIRLDATGNIYTLGEGTLTSASVPNQYRIPASAYYGCIVTKFSPNLGSLLYQTFVHVNGGCKNPFLVVDSTGSATVVAWNSGGLSSFPVVNPVYAQGCCDETNNGFVIKLATTGNAITYSSRLFAPSDSGLTNYVPIGAGVDAQNNLYVAAANYNGDPSFSPLRQGVIKYSPTGTILYWNQLSSLQPAINADGGARPDHLVVTPAGEVMLGAVYKVSSASRSYIVALDAAGVIKGSPYFLLGNGSVTQVSAVARHAPSGDLVIAGITDASNFPVKDAIQSTLVSNGCCQGIFNSFVSRLVFHSVLASTPNPSGLGQPVTLTYTALDNTATGNVQFFDGTTQLGQSALVSGVATLSTSALAGGARTLSAQYGADTATRSHTVTAAAGTVTLTGQSAALEGVGVVLQTQVATAGPVPTGTITLKEGALPVAQATLNAQGQASFTLTPTVGAHSYTATYSGDSSYTPGNVPGLTLTVSELPLVVSINGPVSGSAYVVPTAVPIGVGAVASGGSATVASVTVTVNGSNVAQGTAVPFTGNWTGTQAGTYTVGAYVISARGVRYDAAPVQITTSVTGSAVTYFHHDLSGNTIGSSDQSGQVVYAESYTPYGERVNPQPSPDPTKLAELSGNRTWFHGKAQDEATGLSYFGARYYDPVVGRFMGIDAIGFVEDNPHSFGRYGYGANNPYRYTDPDGQYIIPAVAAVVSCAASLVCGLGVIAIGLVVIAMPNPGGPVGGGYQASPSAYEPMGFPRNPPSISTPIGGDAARRYEWTPLPPSVASPSSPKDHIITKGGENEHTKRGREAHVNYENTLGGSYEFRQVLPSGLKPDAIDWKNRDVRELKPNTPSQIRRGKKQVEGYRKELEAMTGQKWTSNVDTYNK